METAIVAALTEDVLEGGRVVVDVDGTEVGIFRLDGRLYAWENRCAHVGGPVCQGVLMNRVVERLDEEQAQPRRRLLRRAAHRLPVARLRVRRPHGAAPERPAARACARSRSRSGRARSLSASDAVEAARALLERGDVDLAGRPLRAAERRHQAVHVAVARALRRRGAGRPDVTPTEACTVASALLHSQSLTPFEFSVWFSTAGR